ncbi:unnamed protein product [Amoebophrya sp. A25]|nr:unnamed protein product [Amoebophrya sp. A25]|eukprot:GSA25T00020652001.1
MSRESMPVSQRENPEKKPLTPLPFFTLSSTPTVLIFEVLKQHKEQDEEL